MSGHCPVCGETEFDGWDFCPACDHPYDEDPDDDPDEESEDDDDLDDELDEDLDEDELDGEPW